MFRFPKRIWSPLAALMLAMAVTLLAIAPASPVAEQQTSIVEAGGGENASAEIQTPEQVITGQTFSLKVALSSTFSQDTYFSAVIFFANDLSQVGNPIPPTATVTGPLNNPDGNRLLWSGKVKPRGTETLTLPMMAGKKAGTYEFRVKFVMTNSQETVTTQKTLKVVEPIAAKPVEFSLLPSEPNAPTTRVDETTTLALNLNTQGQPVYDVKAVITFDPTLVSVEESYTGDCFVRYVAQGKITVTSGTIIYNATFPGMALKCTGMYVRFKGLKEGIASITLQPEGGATDSNGQRFKSTFVNSKVTVKQARPKVTYQQTGDWRPGKVGSLILTIKAPKPLSWTLWSKACDNNLQELSVQTPRGEMKVAGTSTFTAKVYVNSMRKSLGCSLELTTQMGGETFTEKLRVNLY